MQAMKIILPVCFLLRAAVPSAAQKVVDISQVDADVIEQERITGLVGGQIFMPYKYVKVTEGTPFLQDDWSEGSLLLSGGQQIDHIELRLDLLHHEVHYKDSAGQEMIATTPVRAVTLAAPAGNLIFIQGTPWREIDKVLDGAWLQVLVNDKTSLLLEIRKKVIENTPYGGSTVEQTITETNFYYLQMKGRFVRVRGLSDLPGSLRG